MNLIQLSKNGYILTDVFGDAMFNSISQMSKSANMTKDAAQLREKCDIGDPLRTAIVEHLIPHLKSLTNKFEQIYGMELWRDYPGYTNAYHYDDPSVNNIMIVYLDTHPNLELGTGYVDVDDKHYQAEYRANTGIVVLNSNKLKHGLVGTVPDGVVRYTFYINWK